MKAVTAAELLGEWLAAPADFAPTLAKSAKAANRKDSCGPAADLGVSEALRVAANDGTEPIDGSGDSQSLAALRNGRDVTQSQQRRGVSQDSQDSQGWCLYMQARNRPRPYRLTHAEADEAHAEPWPDAAIERYLTRADALRRLGFAGDDPDDLSERLYLRDLRSDDRRACVECLHLRTMPWRCGNHMAANMAPEVRADLVTALQRCAGFIAVR